MTYLVEMQSYGIFLINSNRFMQSLVRHQLVVMPVLHAFGLKTYLKNLNLTGVNAVERWRFGKFFVTLQFDGYGYIQTITTAS